MLKIYAPFPLYSAFRAKRWRLISSSRFSAHFRCASLMAPQITTVMIPMLKEAGSSLLESLFSHPPLLSVRYEIIPVIDFRLKYHLYRVHFKRTDLNCNIKFFRQLKVDFLRKKFREQKFITVFKYSVLDIFR